MRINNSYALVDCKDCQGCSFLENSHNCYKCQNSLNLENCRNCLFSMNLSNKEFYILNKQVSKEVYEDVLNNKKLYSQLSKEFEKLQKTHPRKENSNLHSINAVGNHIQNSNTICMSYDISDSENCKYTTWMFHSKNCYDVYDW